MDKKKENSNFPLSFSSLSFATWSYTLTMKAQIRNEIEKDIKEEMYNKLYNELYNKLKNDIYNDILEKIVLKDGWQLAESDEIEN